jgi:hypothetical protein
MNCLEAQAVLSAAHDGDVVSEASLALARDHCSECEECTAFAAGLTALDALPTPHAPDGLVERVMEAIAPLAAEREEARSLEAAREQMEDAGVEVPALGADIVEAAALPDPTPAPRTFAGFEWFQGPAKWASLGAVAALAATALIAFVVFGIGGGRTGTPAASTSTGAGATSGLTSGEAAATATTSAPAQTTPAATHAPDYVLYNGFVYTPGALLADASSATPTIGTLATAFASGGTPQSATVYRSPLSDGSIVVRGPDGLRLYSPVVRLLSSARYQLTSGAAIDSFGVWPVLPTRFPTPTAADGTPTFVAAGTDALGVKIYAATGRPSSEGFAVAPGTATTDPAAGDPGWTWWAPAPATP